MECYKHKDHEILLLPMTSVKTKKIKVEFCQCGHLALLTQ